MHILISILVIEELIVGFVLMQIGQEPTAPSSVWWVIITALAGAITALALYIKNLYKEAKKDAKEHKQEYKELSEKLSAIIEKNTESAVHLRNSNAMLVDILKETLREIKRT